MALWRVHAYRFDAEHGTFIVETTEETWRRAGLENASEEETVRFCETLFAEELQGHKLLTQPRHLAELSDGAERALVASRMWRSSAMPRIPRISRWAPAPSSRSRTRSRSPTRSATAPTCPTRFGDTRPRGGPRSRRCSARRKRASQWFEETERYLGTLEPLEFAASLLTRSLRITHENLKMRDPRSSQRIDRWFAEQGRRIRAASTSPPSRRRRRCSRRFACATWCCENRVVVSPMCQYSAEDGMPDDWHLVHLGSRAVGGAGLVMTEMTDVSREGRISPGCAGLYRPEHVARLAAHRRLRPRQQSRAKIGIQLAHAGRKASTRRSWEGDRASRSPTATGR